MKFNFVEGEPKDKLFIDQLQILNKNLPYSLPPNLFCALVVSVALFVISKESFVSSWFFSVLAITFARISGHVFYSFYPEKTLLNYYIFLIGLFFSALMWGLMGSYLMPDNILEQIIIVVIIAGITSAGLQTLNANLFASIMYICTIIVPLSIWLFLHTGIGYFSIGITIVTYLIFMIFSAIRSYNLLKYSLNLAYENVELVEQLSTANNMLTASYQNLEHNTQKMEIITKMNDILQSCSSLNEAYEVITFSAKSLFSGFNGAITILNPSSQCLEILENWGGDNIILPSFEIKDCWAMRQDNIYLVNNSQQTYPCFHFSKIPKAYICMPLNTYNNVLGLLVLYSDEKNFLDLLPQITSFAESVRLSLSNIKLRENLYEQSIRDPLTKLYNRRYLDEILSKELHRAQRNDTTLCVAMLDIDFFKQFNDKYGHEAGDEVLKFTGNLLNLKFRENDFPCRFGGEEFLIILQNSSLANAFQRLEEFRKSIMQGKIYYNNHLMPSITVSIGVAEAPRHGTDASSIIQSADEALYLAKNGGRNAVVQNPK